MKKISSFFLTVFQGPLSIQKHWKTNTIIDLKGKTLLISYHQVPGTALISYMVQFNYTYDALFRKHLER